MLKFTYCLCLLFWANSKNAKCISCGIVCKINVTIKLFIRNSVDFFFFRKRNCFIKADSSDSSKFRITYYNKTPNYPNWYREIRNYIFWKANFMYMSVKFEFLLIKSFRSLYLDNFCISPISEILYYVSILFKFQEIIFSLELIIGLLVKSRWCWLLLKNSVKVWEYFAGPGNLQTSICGKTIIFAGYVQLASLNVSTVQHFLIFFFLL